MGAVVSVLRDRFVPGGASHGVVVGPLSGALAHVFSSDAHFQQGFAVSVGRIAKSTPGPVTMTAAAFDVDGPAHVASPEWRAAEALKVAALLKEWPGLYIYETRHGYRIVGVLPAPIVIEGPHDAELWKARYGAGLELLASRYGIEADPSCADHTRLFRLPHVVRDPGGKVESLPVMGDASAIGCFELPEAPEAEKALISLSCPAGAAKAQTRVIENGAAAAPRAPSERGTLYDLLDERGDVLRAHAPGVWVVRCPRDAEHTTGAAGDTSTLFYAANTLGGSGAIFCQHKGCRGVRTARQWRREIVKADRCRSTLIAS